MKKLHFILSALLLMTFVACGDDENEYQIGKKGTDIPIQTDPHQEGGPEEAKTNLEFPALKGGNSVVIVHNATLNDKLNISGINYSVEWDTDIHAQRWSCYTLYSDINWKSGQNVTRYRPGTSTYLTSDSQYPNDPLLDSKYQFTSDSYRSSGYDHGHICPSADRLRSTDCNYQTFFMTNMQPQGHTFNEGVWGNMEDQLRQWANRHDKLYICKGGTIENIEGKTDYIVKTLGSGINKIPVPRYFFMAVLAQTGSTYKAIGFWINQTSYSSTQPKDYAINIQTLQKNTGIDFFVNLPDDIENEVENVTQSKAIGDWTWTSY